MKVIFMGLGYIGLPTAALVADKGIQVIGVDINSAIVDSVNHGKIHIVEPDLDKLVHNVVTRKDLRAASKPESADAFFIRRKPIRFNTPPLCGGCKLEYA
jgi:UDP-N-acetyl-D-mannosaminuronic acid dehydrogenase